MDHYGVYWRIQGPGEQLSSSHRSEIQSGEGYEEGTSAWESLRQLLYEDSWGVAEYPRGEVEIVAFTGSFVDSGTDGESVVIPEEELGRWINYDWHGAKRFLSANDLDGQWALPDEDLVDEFSDMGWERIGTEPVVP